MLVIGSGLVGSQVARHLVEQGERPVVLDSAPQVDSIARVVDVQKIELNVGNVLDLDQLAELIRKHGIKKIIHTAANPMLTLGANENPYDAIRLNVMGTVNVLEAARKLDVETVVFSSSSSLYKYWKGGKEYGTLKEDNYPRTTTIYATTKLACENLGLNYFETYGVRFVAVRFAAVFGPWAGSGGGGPSVMFKQMVAKSLGGEPTMISPRSIEFVYSKDAGRSTVLAANATTLSTRIYNIGMGKVYTAREIAALVKARLPRANVTISELDVGSPQVEVSKPMDLSRSKMELGYEPEFDMSEALSDYVEWYKKNGF